jgi:hypothetical protein
LDLRDFIVTPFIVMVVYALAYYLRPRLCDENNWRYFFPALTVKIVGALAVGIIYQFYYSGGDTFNYHTYGSRVIWEQLIDDPIRGLGLLFGDSHSLPRQAVHIAFFHDPSSYFVVQVATLFDIITFSTYSGTAVLFAFLSFLGLWYLFLTFYQLFPHLIKWIAICALFVPSVVFWGSGILKDTIIMTSLGFATYLIKKIFLDRRFSMMSVLMLFLSLFVIFFVKKYVLLCYMPVVLLWIYMGNLHRIPSAMVKVLMMPLILVVTLVSGYYAIQKVAEDDPKYALDKIAETARVTAYDIGFWSGKNAGSTYSLGELDGSFGSLISHMPAAINVALFRPYLWEVKNPLMLLSSLEALALLTITVYLFVRAPLRFIRSLGDANVLFCLIFSISFAFAVGAVTYNFGTLNRYKIPLIPFYLIALTIIAHHSNNARKLDVLDQTE